MLLSTRAEIESIIPLTDSILQLILRPERYIPYQAGQYLQIRSKGETLSYSIANAPLGSHKYELHIRHNLENISVQNLLTELKRKGAVTISMPLGDCHLDKLNREKPILFLAQGTGFAPIKAMIEQLLATGDKRPFELFWGARSQSDLYMEATLQQWQNHVVNFRYFSLITSVRKKTLLALVLKHHQHELQKWQIVIGGSFDMVYSLRDNLVAEGMAADQLFSDAFSFEKKE